MCLPRWSLFIIGVWAKGSWKWFQPGFQDHNHRQISRNESGVATETSLSPAPVAILRASLSPPGNADPGVLGGVSPRMNGAALLKKDLPWILKLNQNKLWLLFCIPKWDEGFFTWKDHSAFGNSNYQVASLQGNLNNFFIPQEYMWIIREVRKRMPTDWMPTD